MVDTVGSVVEREWVDTVGPVAAREWVDPTKGQNV